MKDEIRWETPTYGTSRSAAIADYKGHRLYVKRTAPGRREFDGKIDGGYVGSWDTLDMAKSQTAKRARKEFDNDAT